MALKFYHFELNPKNKAIRPHIFTSPVKVVHKTHPRFGAIK